MGENGMLTGEKSTATCRAVRAVILLEISKPTLNRLMRDSPTLRTYLETFIADRKALNKAKLLAMNESKLLDAPESEATALFRSASSGSCTSGKLADGIDEEAKKKAQLLQMLAFTPSAEQKRETEEAAEQERQRAAAKFKIKAVERAYLEECLCAFVCERVCVCVFVSVFVCVCEFISSMDIYINIYQQHGKLLIGGGDGGDGGGGGSDGAVVAANEETNLLEKSSIEPRVMTSQISCTSSRQHISNTIATY